MFSRLHEINSLISFNSFISYDWRCTVVPSFGGSMTTSTLDPVAIPTSQQEQIHELHSLLQKEGKASLVGKGGESSFELPGVVYSLLLRILQGMQEGKAISIVPVTQDLTTQEAANVLGVSGRSSSSFWKRASSLIT